MKEEFVFDSQQNVTQTAEIVTQNSFWSTPSTISMFIVPNSKCATRNFFPAAIRLYYDMLLKHSNEGNIVIKYRERYERKPP